MSTSKYSSKNKILLAGPNSELKQNLESKLAHSDFETRDFVSQHYGQFLPDYLVFTYNKDLSSDQSSLRQLFDEFLEAALVLQKPFFLVVNIDPFLELNRRGKSVIFPEKFAYISSSDYDPLYPIEKLTKLINNRQLKGSIIKVGYLYSANITNLKSIIDYFLTSAQTGLINLPNNHPDFIYPTSIDDVSFGIVRSVISFKNKRNIYLFNPSPISLNSLSKTIKEEFRHFFSFPVKINIHPTQQLPRLKIETKDLEKSAVKLNWSPKSSLILTIRQINLADFKSVSHRKKNTSKSHKKYYIYTAIGFIFIFLLPVIFFVLNSFSALYDLKLAQNAVSSNQYDVASQRAKFSQAKFNRNLIISNILNVLPGASDKIFFINDLNHFSLSGFYLAKAFENGVSVARTSQEFIKTIEGEGNNNLAQAIATIQPKISTISDNLQLSYLESLKLTGVIGGSQIKNYQQQLNQYALISQRAKVLVPLLPDFLGTDQSKKYLILNLNNNELRPGGGFIGSYSTLDFEMGKFSSLKVGDIYDIDGQLKQKIPAPAPLVDSLGVDSWYLRDANWDPDFNNNYPVIKEFYLKETGETIDGLMAVDLEFIRSVLSYTGPINLEDYQETVSAENISELGQKYSEVNFFPGSRQKKNFFSSLSRKLIDEIITHKKYLDPNFLLVIDRSLATQSLQVSIENQSVKNTLDSLGFSNEIPGRNYSSSSEKTNDYLMLVDANIGANKSNAFIDKKINYTLNMDKNGNLLSEAEVIYTNSSPNNSWPAGDYKNYLRLFTPHGSKLERVTINGIDTASAFQSFDDGKLTFFAGNILVPFNSTLSIQFSYTQPKGLDPATKINDYYFYYQKQAGTYGIEFNFKFNHPDFVKVTSPDQFELSPQQALNSRVTDTSFSLELQTSHN